MSIELHAATRHCRDMTEKLLKVTLNPNIYILSIFTEKPYRSSKALEHNVVYIPIITLSHATSHDFK